MTANSRLTRCTITVALYGAVVLGGLVLGSATSHKPAAAPAIEMAALADAPKLPIEITEVF